MPGNTGRGKPNPPKSAAISPLPTRKGGLPKDSRALCDQVRTVDKGRVSRTVGVLDRPIMQKLDRGLILHLQLEDYLKT